MNVLNLKKYIYKIKYFKTQFIRLSTVFNSYRFNQYTSTMIFAYISYCRQNVYKQIVFCLTEYINVLINYFCINLIYND